MEQCRHDFDRARSRGEDFNLVPLGLSDEFARDVEKRAQWKAFLGKNRLEVPALGDVIEEIRRLVAEPLAWARQKPSAP